ncbi:MAG: beta-galactosidase [Chthoniobacter sp.]|jgi:hypothetical protein|nr:beta-galactosidase [Chthoniobacter sp.]
MKPFVFLFASLLAINTGGSQSIDLTHPDTSVQSGHLRMGGKNPQGVEINANNRYLTLGGKPWLPVMGEFHFTRYPRAQWEEELLKMKAGGVDIVATYIFWIHHEEEEGTWDWSGNKDLRAFTALCQKHGLLVYPRLGPWAHGEVRNGGFPDWLLKKCGKEVRKDTEPYLTEVRQFYTQVYTQLQGLLWRDGGPVVGIQLENELTRGAAHILSLKKMAQEVGFDVPLYTMTGWMTAQVPQDEVLPMSGGYADAFWISQTKEWERKARQQYQFTLERDDTTIGLDVAGGEVGNGDTKKVTARNPFATCETGGGMMVSYTRRPVIEGDDTGALAMVKIGCGSNLPGYYMYQGGANPLGKLTTLQESKATGYPNDLPVINYDFQAPLRQYGQRGPAYNALRVLHLFLHDFGSDLATMPAALPDQKPTSLDDSTTLRWSARSDGTRGFVFINNYQRVETLPEHKGVQLELKLKDETLKIPSEPIDIPAQTYFIWPFNMDLNGVRLKYATAQPLCRAGDTFVFSAIDGIESEFVFDPATQASEGAGKAIGTMKPNPGQPITLIAKSGASLKVLLLSHSQTLQAYKASIWDAERLFLSDAGLVFDRDSVRMQSRDLGKMSLAYYPPTVGLTQESGAGAGRTDGVFEHFFAEPPRKQTTAQWNRIKPAAPAPEVKKDKKGVAVVPDDAAFDGAEVWQVTLPKDALDGAHETFLQIHYTGDIARAYIGDQLIDDDFYFGRPWEIGLRRFAPEVLQKGITLKILPLRKDAPLYIPKDRLPEFGENGEAVGVSKVTLTQEYEIALHPAKGE